MLRATAFLNHAKCVSSAFSKQGVRFARPMSVSAVRMSGDTAKKEDHDVDSLFNVDSGSRSEQQQNQRRHRFSTCINKIDLLGGVADNPIEKVTRNGNPYISFNMFTNVEFRKPDGSFDENVELHNIIVFGGLMNYIRRNVQKGTRVFVTGRLHYSGNPDQGFGVRVPRSASIVVESVHALAKPASAFSSSNSDNN